MRVFSENDVRGLLTRYIGSCVEHGVIDGSQAERVLSDGPVSRALAAHKGELTEEVIARSAVVRLVAKAWADAGETPDDAVDAEAFVNEHLPQLAPAQVIPRGQADRLVALALVESGCWDREAGDAIPQAVWDELYTRKLIVSGRDQTGEGFVTSTVIGRAFLLTELKRGR